MCTSYRTGAFSEKLCADFPVDFQKTAGKLALALSEIGSWHVDQSIYTSQFYHSRVNDMQEAVRLYGNRNTKLAMIKWYM